MANIKKICDSSHEGDVDLRRPCRNYKCVVVAMEGLWLLDSGQEGDVDILLSS